MGLDSHMVRLLVVRLLVIRHFYVRFFVSRLFWILDFGLLHFSLELIVCDFVELPCKFLDFILSH